MNMMPVPVMIEEELEAAEGYFRSGQTEKAETLLNDILAAHPSAPHGLYLLGLVMFRKGDPGKAEALITRAISLDPAKIDFHLSLGNIYETCGRTEQAESLLRASFQANPLSPAAALNLADFFARNDRLSEAEAVYRYVLDIDPRSHAAFNNLGNIAQSRGNLDEARTLYEKALRIEPGLVETMNNLGMALMHAGRFREAEDWFRKAISLRPDLVEAIDNCGSALMEQGRYEEARQEYLKALSLEPDHGDAAFNLSYIMLMEGDFAHGLPLYERRLDKKEFSYLKDARSLKPGDTLKDKTILVRCEQGLGDTLQFVRFLPLLKDRGANVVLELQPQLIRLLSRCGGIDDIVPRKGDLSAPDVRYDHSVPLLSLPYLFGISADTIPADVPYIHLADDTIRKWREATSPRRDNNTLLAGIVWSGNRRYSGNASRSLSLERFYPVFSTPGACFYSLQFGEAVEEAGRLPPLSNLLFMTDEIREFTDTAGLMKNLDLIITIDSVTAHLAGALGVTVWNLLPYVPDWRWRLKREDSAWYPTMRLFRQSSLDDRESLLEGVRAALVDLLDGRSQPANP